MTLRNTASESLPPNSQKPMILTKKRETVNHPARTHLQGYLSEAHLGVMEFRVTDVPEGDFVSSFSDPKAKDL